MKERRHSVIKGKKILFITDSCPPNLTMSGIVVKNIIDYLIDENDIDIIAIQQGDDDCIRYKGIKVDYIKSYPYYILNNRKKKNNSNNIFLSLCYAVKVFFFRIISILSRFLSPIGLNKDIVKKIIKKAENKMYSMKYDYVLCNAKPFESFDAIARLVEKYPSTRFIAYQTDDYVTAGDERYMPKSIIVKKHNNRMERINRYVEIFDTYGMLESVYKKEIGFINKQEKVICMGIPLLFDKENVKDANNIIIKKNNKVSFVYAGSLVKSFRPPNECFEIMLEVIKKIDASIDVYHRGDCDDIVNVYQNKSKGLICNRGTVSADESYSAIDSADVLISISNIAGDQISGKTFDYINTGKPIIHFYYDNNDMNAEVLERYSNGISVCVSDISVSHDINRIVEFVHNNVGNIVLNDEILALYSEYTVEMVEKRLFEGE